MRKFIQLFAVIFLTSSVNLFAQIGNDLQFSRENNKEGIHVFEPSKADDVVYTGMELNIEGDFTQGFQMLNHENANGGLYALGSGFNLAAANLNFNVQLADGVRVYLENYMASRHHNEFWVKGGYIQMDKLPFIEGWDWFDKYMRVKIGHMEVNYGDQHFRRSDGGSTIFNPFVENHIVDQFTTEIGGELYVFPTDGLMLMLGLTNGLINNNVFDYDSNPAGAVQKKSPSILLKAAYDQESDDLRYRLSASVYTNSETPRNTLFSGDRTGSNYYGVMENVDFNATSNFRSGRFSIGNFNSLTSIMINPFIKYKGLEFFGTYEIINGKTIAENDDRQTTQVAGELIYRFAENDQLYLGGRYNTVTSQLSGATEDVSIDRVAVVLGWFPTKNLVLKGEYVVQNYNDFGTESIYRDGKFDGVTIQAAVAF